MWSALGCQLSLELADPVNHFLVQCRLVAPPSGFPVACLRLVHQGDLVGRPVGHGGEVSGFAPAVDLGRDQGLELYQQAGLHVLAVDLLGFAPGVHRVDGGSAVASHEERLSAVAELLGVNRHPRVVLEVAGKPVVSSPALPRGFCWLAVAVLELVNAS